MSKYLLDEGAHLVFYDPKVDEKQIIIELSNHQLNLPTDVVKKRVTVVTDPYEAAKDSHAIIVCTEWDEFKVREKMQKRIKTEFNRDIFFSDTGLS